MQPPHRPSTLVGQLFVGSSAVRDGLLTAHQLRSSAWMRILHDVYADARLACDHELKCRAAALRLPPTAVFAGPSAAYLDGVGHAAGYRDEVHVIVPKKIRVGPRVGVRIHSTDLDPFDTVTRDGLLRTVPARTAWDVGSWLDVVPAVATIDGLVRRRLVEHGDLAEMARRFAGRPWPGSRRARRAFALVDGRAANATESALRVRLTLTHLPRPVPRHRVTLASGMTCHADLAWPQLRVAVECEPADLSTDVVRSGPRRLGALTAAGWVVVHVSGQRLRRDFPVVYREIHDALSSRGWRP